MAHVSIRDVLCVSRLFLGLGACTPSRQPIQEEPDANMDGSSLAGVVTATPNSGFWNRDGQLTTSELFARTQGKTLDPGLSQMDFMRPILKGVLYRGGFDSTKGQGVATGGMTATHQKTLCSKGITHSFSYLDFGTNQISGRTCGPANTAWEYERGDEQNYTKFLTSVWNAINDKTSKIFVHCRWGVHASGFAATAALHQFCGKNKDGTTAPINFGTDEAAFKYWDNARNKSPYSDGWYERHWRAYQASNPHFDKLITRAQQDEICPR